MPIVNHIGDCESPACEAASATSPSPADQHHIRIQRACCLAMSAVQPRTHVGTPMFAEKEVIIMELHFIDLHRQPVTCIHSHRCLDRCTFGLSEITQTLAQQEAANFDMIKHEPGHDSKHRRCICGSEKVSGQAVEPPPGLTPSRGSGFQEVSPQRVPRHAVVAPLTGDNLRVLLPNTSSPCNIAYSPLASFERVQGTAVKDPLRPCGIEWHLYTDCLASAPSA